MYQKLLLLQIKYKTMGFELSHLLKSLNYHINYTILNIASTIKEYREWQLKMYNRWEDTLEVRLAGIKAAKEKLEEQMNRETDGN